MANIPRTSFDRLLGESRRTALAIEDLYGSKQLLEEVRIRRDMLRELGGGTSLIDEARKSQRLLKEAREGGILREGFGTKRLVDELREWRRTALLEQARGTLSAYQALERGMAGGPAQSFGVARSLHQKRYVEASALMAGAEAASRLNEAVWGRRSPSQLLREYQQLGLRASEAVAQMRAYRKRDDFGDRIAEQIERLTGSWGTTALNARRLAQFREARYGLLNDPSWQRLPQSLQALTEPLGTIVRESGIAELSGRRPRGWTESIKAEEKFWSEAGARIEGLSETPEAAGPGLVDLLQSITGHLWKNTKAKGSRLNLFDLFNLLASLLGIAAFLAQIAESEEPPPAPAGEVESGALPETFAEAKAILDRSIAAVTAWMEIQAAEHLGRSARGETRGRATVRTGPGTSFSTVVRLPAGTAVAVRERRPRWRSVAYRDPLTGSLEEGWISAGLVEELE